MLLSFAILCDSFYVSFYFNFHFQFASICKHLILEICDWGMEVESLPNVTGIIYRTSISQIYLERYRYMLSTATAFLRGHFKVIVHQNMYRLYTQNAMYNKITPSIVSVSKIRAFFAELPRGLCEGLS